tara:strand:+ start:2672 stop:3613 length:942 start_codon:yes stop_codon:yes gene_type:complete
MDPFTLALLGSTAVGAIGGLMGNRASNQAAGVQSMAALQAAQIQAQQAQAAREQLERSQAQGAQAIGDYYGKGAEAYAPYQQFGVESTNRLATLMGLRPGAASGSLMEQPTIAQLKFDPGYEFRFSQGMRGVNASAAANAGLQSGAALKAAERFGAGEASQEYGNAYKRFMDNRLNQIAMLQGGVNTGLTAGGGTADLAGRAGLGLANLYSGTGANLAETTLGAGRAMGAGLENAAAARASGYMGGASALQGALQTPVNAMMAYGMADRFAPQNRTSTYAPQQVGYLGGAPSYGAGYSPGFMGAPTFGAPRVG